MNDDFKKITDHKGVEMQRCNAKGCPSYAFNLERDGIEQGDLCDVHYWQSMAESMRDALQSAMKALTPNVELTRGPSKMKEKVIFRRPELTQTLFACPFCGHAPKVRNGI